VRELEQGSLRLASLLGTPVARPGGEAHGRVHEVRARLEGSEGRPGALHVTGVIAGKAGWAQRLVGPGTRGGHPSPDAGLIDWAELGWSDGALIVG
jgi:hypothetical protein